MTSTTKKAAVTKRESKAKRIGHILTSWPVRLIGTCICVWLLVRNIDVHEALLTLRGADLRMIGIVLALTLGVMAAGMAEWAVLVRSMCSLSWARLSYIFFKSLAAQHLIPTGLGGDALRIYEVRKETGTASATAASFVGRLGSTTAMLIWAVIGSIYMPGRLGDWALTISSIAMVGVMALWAMTLKPNAAAMVLANLAKQMSNRAPKGILQFAAELKELRTNPQTLATCLCISLTGWGLQWFTLSLLAQSLGMNVPWYLFAVAFPFSLVATMAPFALNGYGLREGILMGILINAGIQASPAAALALLVDLQMLPYIFLSALLWLPSTRRQAL